MHFILLIVLIILFGIICYQLFDLFHNREYGGMGEFPHRRKFKSVAETHYSVAGPYQTQQEIQIFKSLFNKNTPPKKIIDATAHVGVDSITLAYSFPNAHVTSVERNPKVYELLKANITNLGYDKQIIALNMSADIYLDKLDHTVDLIYMDPPWGGRGYKPASDLPLHDESGNPTIPLSKVINLTLKKTKLLVLKAPYNFIVDEFGKNINGKIESIRKIHRANDKTRASFIFIIIRP